MLRVRRQRMENGGRAELLAQWGKLAYRVVSEMHVNDMCGSASGLMGMTSLGIGGQGGSGCTSGANRKPRSGRT